MKPLLLPDEVARHLRTEVEVVRDLIVSGKLPVVILDNGELRVDMNALRRYVRARTVPSLTGSRRAELVLLRRMWRSREET
jgi:hypothetical protein